MPDTPTMNLEKDLAPRNRDLLASFCLLRTAALPYSMLEDLKLPETRVVIEQILLAERVMESCRPRVEDSLFQLVGQFTRDQKNLRNDALEARRDAHNGRITRLSDARLEEILKRLEESDREVFARWIAAQRDLRSARKQLEATLSAEVRGRLRPALRAPLQLSSFRRALGLASPGLSQALSRKPGEFSKALRPDKLERTLMGYLGRAAAKTSPFSSFMGLSVLRVDPQAKGYPYAVDASCVGYARLNRGIVSRLQRQSLREAIRCGEVPLRTNPTLSVGTAGRVRALCDREVILLGRPWVEQRWAQFRLDERIVGILHSQPGSLYWDQWCFLMTEAGIPEDKVAPTVDKLIERGMLLPPPLFDTFDASPAHTLAAWWGSSRSSQLSTLGDSLQSMTGLAARVSDADGAERATLVEKIRSKERRILKALGDGESEEFHNVILEDCWLSGLRNATLGADLQSPLSSLRSFLGTQVIVSPFYQRLRDRFVADYGHGGTCLDCVGFLLRAAEGLVDIPEFGAKPKEELPTPAPANTQIPVTAQVQIVAGLGIAAPMVVVNRVFDGAGWLVARFSSGEGPRQLALRQEVSAWLSQIHAPREPVDVVMGGHCNDLQAHAQVTRRVLRWPGEPVLLDADRIIDAETITISHNPRTDLLETTDRHGVPISLVYLGSTFPSPLWGVRYALSILTQPYLVGRPNLRPPLEGAREPVIFEDRLTHDSLIIKRATWWVSTEYLKREWFVPNPVDRFVRIKRECDKYGIPDVFYAQRHVNFERSSLIPANVLDAYRKPMWIDALNPFSLEILERIAAEGEWLSFSEPLPGPSGMWMKVDGQPHVSELQIEMVISATESAIAGPKPIPNNKDQVR